MEKTNAGKEQTNRRIEKTKLTNTSVTIYVGGTAPLTGDGINIELNLYFKKFETASEILSTPLATSEIVGAPRDC